MLKPLHDYVVLEKVKEETKTASGIILTDKPKEQPSQGIVLAVGEGEIVDGKLMPLTLKVNDKVIYKKYGGTEVEIDQQEYLIISAKDILAVIE